MTSGLFMYSECPVRGLERHPKFINITLIFFLVHFNTA